MLKSDFTTEFLAKIRDQVVPRIVRATLPFYAVQNDEIVRDRSGVFLRVGDEYFILTASHHLEAIVGHNIYLYVGWDEEDKVPVPIPDATFHVTEEDIRDVAVIKLSREAAKKILSSHEPVGLRDIKFNVDRRPGLFLICGYPQAWLHVLPDHLESHPLPFLSGFYEGTPSATADMKYDENLHGLFQFTREALGDGAHPVSLPPFKGIQGVSGCGVWRICTFEEGVEGWSPEKCKLVAIQHRYNEKLSYVHTTWAKYALDRLTVEYPSVRKAMSLILPN